MTLSPGAKLGPYEILAPIGSGGMSARGDASRRRRISVSSRRGWGPAASAKMMTPSPFRSS